MPLPVVLPATLGPMTRWQQLAGADAGIRYARKLADRAESGADMHGEAALCEQWVTAPGRVLDAGCGTGRVAIRLAERGYQVTGIDADESMLAEARRAAPELEWVHADLAGPLPGRTAGSSGWDAVVCAGNVIPLLAEGTLSTVLANLSAQLAPAGVVLAGFGLGATHLPKGCPPTPLAEFDAALTIAGLAVVERLAAWDGKPYAPGCGYAVSILRHAAPGLA